MLTRRKMMLNSVGIVSSIPLLGSECDVEGCRKVYRQNEDKFYPIEWKDIQKGDHLLIIDFDGRKEITQIEIAKAVSIPDFSKQGHPFMYTSDAIPYGGVF